MDISPAFWRVDTDLLGRTSHVEHPPSFRGRSLDNLVRWINLVY